MSTLRIHGIEAKSDPTSASVNEKIKITNSNGDLLLHLDGTQRVLALLVSPQLVQLFM